MADVDNKMVSSPSELFESITEGVFAIPADDRTPSGVEGKYEKRFLIAINEEYQTTWNLSVFKQLRKLIQSMKINRKSVRNTDVGLINLQIQPFDHLAKLIEHTKPNHLILFISTWNFAEVEIRKYETQKVGSLNILRLPNLAEVRLNTDNKQKTWSSIKRYLDM